jgi:DtxR family manganese transport transcriptional regulator
MLQNSQRERDWLRWCFYAYESRQKAQILSDRFVKADRSLRDAGEGHYGLSPGENRMNAKEAKPDSTSPAGLPAEADQALRFEKARSAQASAILEDYVELIDDLLMSDGEARPTDIARRLGVSHATAIKSIARLKREGLATSKLYRGVFLTSEGHGLAARVRARHRLVVDLLVAVGVPERCAELDAEGIEHHVSDVALAAFSRFLKRCGRA